MPTTYAHDLFGKMVYCRLPKDLQRKVQRHRATWQIGQHGPDILFYVQPFRPNGVNRIGYKLHREEAAGFFERGRRLYQETGNEEILVYLMGFLCHFMLDSTCHPYISEYMKKTGAGHDQIETELDRRLMERTGKDPFRYHPADVIRLQRKSIRAITQVLEGTTPRTIRMALLGMKFYTRVPVCHTRRKRRLILGFSRAFGIYRIVQGRVMRERPVPLCLESTEQLTRLLLGAVPETAALITEYVRNIANDAPLNPRLNRNYK